MRTRERFNAVVNFREFDRLPIVEWAGWWTATIERWQAEGLDRNLAGHAINEHFGQDVYKQIWFPATGPEAPRPAHHGAGIIETADDYKRLRKHLFDVDKMWPNYEKHLAQWQVEQDAGDIAVWITLTGFFWYPRELFGIENHLFAFYDHPDLMKEILDELAEWMIKVVDRVCGVCTPDFMTFAEDMSYNNGPMLSEELFDEFMLPYYQRVIPHLESRGILPVVDSDGDVTIAAEWFERAGIRGILPIERQAGTDIAELRRNHPEMIFIGCYDKMVMNQGEAAMRKEFERLIEVAKGGGMIISCDHQTPPGVSLEDYRLYMDLFREYACKCGGTVRSLTKSNEKRGS